MIREIFLDLDDVCNTLAVWILYKRGCYPSPTDYTSFPRECGYNVVTAANRLGSLQYTIPSFWDSIPRQWWAAAPESEVFPWILNACEVAVGRENVCVATRPTDDPDCLAGKLEWIHDHMPLWMHHQYAVTPQKHRFGHPHALLIDDSPANIDAFVGRGGCGLLVPRPWNAAWGEEPRKYLEENLQKVLQNR